MSSYEFIEVAVSGEVARIDLIRAPLNVLHIPMMKELNTALDTLLTRNDFKVLVIAARAKAFSAGVDISDHTPERVDEMIDVFHGIFRRMVKFTVPTIAVVEGAALGGGCELAIACDIVLASEKAKFGQPEIAVGVLPPIACAILPRRIGWSKAMDFVTSGVTISAREAEQWGMATRVYPVEGFAEAVAAYISQFTAHSRVVIEYTKQALTIGSEKSFSDALPPIESTYLNDLMKTSDAKEGLQAFLDKRKPQWKNC